MYFIYKNPEQLSLYFLLNFAVFQTENLTKCNLFKGDVPVVGTPFIFLIWRKNLFNSFKNIEGILME